MGAMPAAVLHRRARVAFARHRIPVALVARIGIAQVAIAGHEGVADEVVAGQDVRIQVAVRGDARVQHRDHDARAGRTVPGRRQVDATDRILEVPLILVVVGVVGHQARITARVHFDEFDIGIRRQLAQQAFGLHAIQLARGLHQFRADAEAAQLRGAHRLAVSRTQRGTRDSADQRTLQRCTAGARRAAVAVLHDETVVGLAVAQTGGTDIARRGGACDGAQREHCGECSNQGTATRIAERRIGIHLTCSMSTRMNELGNPFTNCLLNDLRLPLQADRAGTPVYLPRHSSRDEHTPLTPCFQRFSSRCIERSKSLANCTTHG